MRGSIRPAEALRVGILLLLAVLLLVGVPGEDAGPEGALSLPAPLRATSPQGDDGAAWERLLRHAAEAPLVAEVSGMPPPFVVEPPQRLRAGRPAGLEVAAFEPVRVRLVTPAGIEEELRLGEGERGAFVLRPRTAGWGTWTIDWSSLDDAAPGGGGEGSATWTGWAEPERPLRILALGGPPDPESRFALRALEEAGEEAEAWLHLGRELWVGRPSGPLPDEAPVFEAFDVVILFPGLPLPAGTAEAIERAVRDGGTGLLLAAAAGGSESLLAAALRAEGAGGWGEAGAADAEALRWRLPAEVEPLPSEELTVARRPLVLRDGPDGGEGEPPVVLGTLGRGRIGALAVADTWRWRMQAGAEAEHRAFWRSLAEWLAGGLGDDPVLEPLGELHRRGEAVRVRWVERERAASPGGPAGADTTLAAARVRLTGPEGEVRTIDLPALQEAPFGAVGTAGFVPFDSGGYRLEPLGPDGEPAGPGIGIAARGLGEGWPDADGVLARLALLSPGGGVEIAGAAALDADRPPAPEDRNGLLAALLFALLAGLLGAEWILRRSRARP